MAGAIGTVGSWPATSIQRPRSAGSGAENQEVIDNLAAAGLVDAVSTAAGGPVPTFRHSRGSIQHQLDYLYLSAAAREGLKGCRVVDDLGVFEHRLSDHLPILGTWSKG